MMELTYTTVDSAGVTRSTPFHELGDIIILGQTKQGMPAEEPTQWDSTLRVKVVITSDTPDFHSNYSKIQAVQNALSIAKGTLLWTNESNGQTYFNRDVTVESHDCPEDPNAIGTWRQEIEVAFRWKEKIESGTERLSATFQRTGSATTVSLTHVESWKDGLAFTRFDELHDERSGSQGTVSVSGKFIAESAMTLAQKRSYLASCVTTAQAEMNGQSGLLQYGTAGAFFNRTVRVSEFSADINQATDEVPWTLTATYTRFPNEAGYAIADMTVSVNNDNESGDSVLSFSGRIAAHTKTEAQAKLDVLRTAVLAAESFTTAKCDRKQTDCRNVSVCPTSGATTTDGLTIVDTPNADTYPSSAYTFIELSFSEDYRKKSTDLKRWTLRRDDVYDATNGITATVYSGQVIAPGSTYQDAYDKAITQAEYLGRHKHQVLLGMDISADYRREESPTASTQELVTLSFTYRYLRVDSARRYFEVTVQSQDDSMSESTDTVTGFVVAESQAMASSIYTTTIKKLPLLASRPIRGEQTSYQDAYTSTDNLTVTTITATAENTFPYTSSAEAVIESGAAKGYTKRDGVRLDFSFTLHKDKENTFYSMKYDIEVSNDYVAAETTTRINGVIMASTKTNAEGKLNEYLRLRSTDNNYVFGTVGMSEAETVILGSNRTAYTTTESYERLPTSSDAGALSKAFVGLNFSATFTKQITGDSGIIEYDLSDSIQYSGTRYVVQNIPSGPSIIQNCGTEPGQRTVSGTVTATTEAKCWEKARSIYTYFPFPTSENHPSTPSTRYRSPIQGTVSWKWMPRTVDPIARGIDIDYETGDAKHTDNFKAVSLNFSFTEILPSFTLWAG